MRATLVVIGVLTVVAASAAAHAQQPQRATAVYLVSPDARLCPSPMCGGAWVRQVNHATTRCADGSTAAACYVAAVRRVGARSLPDGSVAMLARGRLMPAHLEGFPDLARLDVVAAWRPAGAGDGRGTTYRVRDNGIRCVAAPCFSLTAAVIETTRRRALSSLDLSRVGAAARDLRRATAAVAASGLLVTGVVRIDRSAGPAGDGRVLVASQIWLP